MRIAHVTSTFLPYHGGTGNVCYHHAQELARRGHDIHVFTAAMPGAQPRERRDGFTIHRLRSLVQIGNAPLLPGLLKELRGFDLIHLHCPFILGAEMVSLAAALIHTRLVVSYHSDLIHPGNWRDLIFRLATWSSRFIVMQRADRILFVSQGHAETNDQREVYRKRRAHCDILPNGVDIHAFQPQPDRQRLRESLSLPIDAQVVGFVAALDTAHHYKGLSILLRALAAQSFAGTYLLVVGDGDLKEQYRHQVHELGIPERVVFYGAAGHEVLPSLYQACDVVTMPSLVPESFGLVVIEALACGVPVIASDGPGVRSLLQHGSNGLLVEPGNVAMLAEAIRYLLQDDAARRRMGQLGRAKIKERYDWAQIGIQLETIYQDVLDEFKEQMHVTEQSKL